MTTCLGIRNATHWADARSVERMACYLLITNRPTGHLQCYTKTQKYNETQ